MAAKHLSTGVKHLFFQQQSVNIEEMRPVAGTLWRDVVQTFIEQTVLL